MRPSVRPARAARDTPHDTPKLRAVRRLHPLPSLTLDRAKKWGLTCPYAQSLSRSTVAQRELFVPKPAQTGDE